MDGPLVWTWSGVVLNTCGWRLARLECTAHKSQLEPIPLVTSAHLKWPAPKQQDKQTISASAQYSNSIVDYTAIEVLLSQNFDLNRKATSWNRTPGIQNERTEQAHALG